jgi:hypothetical protein
MTPDQIAQLITEDPNYQDLPDSDQFGPDIEEIRRTNRHGDFTVKPHPYGWEFWHDDYDGAPDGNRWGGSGRSLEEILPWMLELEEEIAAERADQEEQDGIRDTVEPDPYDAAESFGAFQSMQHEDEDLSEAVLESLDASLDGPNLQSTSEVPDDNQLLDVEDEESEIDLDTDDEQSMALQTDLEAQKEAEEAALQQQQKILEPQINDLEQQVGDINQHALRGLSQVQDGSQALGGMDKQLLSVQQLLQSLRRSV